MFCFCFFIARRKSFKIQISPMDGKQVYHLIVAPKTKTKEIKSYQTLMEWWDIGDIMSTKS